jgi:hypothetical protein
MSIKGRCLCGAVQYTVSSEPVARRTCWCRLCQYLSAGGGTVNALFKRADVTVQGETCDYASIAACGTPMFGYAEERAHLLVVRVGTMENPSACAPVATIWASQAPSWACINHTLPQIEGQPPPPSAN